MLERVDSTAVVTTWRLSRHRSSRTLSPGMCETIIIVST